MKKKTREIMIPKKETTFKLNTLRQGCIRKCA